MTAPRFTHTHFDYLLVISENPEPSVYSFSNNWVRELAQMGYLTLSSLAGRQVKAIITDAGRREVLWATM